MGGLLAGSTLFGLVQTMHPPILYCSSIAWIFISIEVLFDLTGILNKAKWEATAWPLPWVGGRLDQGS